ncbi:non-structural maintenance of chromosomes element 4 homolog A-like protein [Tanacetum coccineum]
MTINNDRQKRIKTEDDNRSTVLRSGYRSIQKFIRNEKDEIAAASPKKFKSILNEFDGMHKHVKKPKEQVSDAEALRDLASTLITSIRVQSTGSVTPSVFVSSLINKFSKKGRIGNNQRRKILWKDIGLHVSPLLKTCRGLSTMTGPMDREPKPPRAVKVYTRRKRRRGKPEELEDCDSKVQTETEMTIAIMFNILKRKRNVGLVNLCLNRTSFAQTVENLFALSFLVKDGRVVITVDEKGSHHVSPRNAPSSGSIMSGKVAHSHFVFSFDLNDWKLMKDVVAEGSELMPHRNVNPGGESEFTSNSNNNHTSRTTTKTPIKTPWSHEVLVSETAIGEFCVLKVLEDMVFAVFLCTKVALLVNVRVYADRQMLISLVGFLPSINFIANSCLFVDAIDIYPLLSSSKL